MAVLDSHGVDGVRVEQLAKRLKVTKGSFYWHFKDRDALLLSMLDHWRQQNTIDIVETAGEWDDPLAWLQAAARMPFDLEAVDGFGLPLRIWARHDERARKVLLEVDGLRVRMMAQVFAAAGFAPEEAQARGVILYSYMRVAPTLTHLLVPELKTMCENLLLDLPARSATAT